MQKLGTIKLELPPSEGNPRNSEGAFLKLKDGRLLFVYSKFTGDSFVDHAPSCIAAMYSEDEGESWSDEHIIAEPQEYGAVNLMSVSLLRMSNGDIGLFYFVRKVRNDGRLHVQRSADEGKTWSTAQCCIPMPGYFVTNNDRVIRLTSGRLVVPAALHKMAKDSPDRDAPYIPIDGKGITHFFLSDDDGVTWREAQNFCTLTAARSRFGLQEPGVIELNNGALWAWARTDMGRQYEMFSHDGGETWSQAESSVFTSPRSPLSMKRIPQSGHLLAVWNPIPEYQTRESGHARGRTPLIGGISQDEGKTWDDFFYLEKEEDRGGYCYTAIYFLEDAVLFAYCAGMPEDGNQLARLRIRKVKLSDIV